MNHPSHRLLRPVASRRAFTLIELLTVIAIIGILAAIIIPTVAKVRQTARRSQCSSNMRQIALAMIAYANDSKGNLPLANDTTATERAGKVWDAMLRPYLNIPIASDGTTVGPSEVLRCPTDPRPLVVNEASKQWARSYKLPRVTSDSAWASGVGLWARLSNPEQRSRNMSQLAFPSKSVMLLESYTETEANWQFKGAFTVADAWATNAGANFGRINGEYLHGSVINFAFADGHVVSTSPAAVNTTAFNDFRAF